MIAAEDLRLTFGDAEVAMHINSRFRPVRRFAEFVVAVLWALPAVSPKMRRVPEVLVLATDRDPRWAERVEPLVAELRRSGYQAELWIPGVDTPEWRGCAFRRRHRRVALRRILTLFIQARSDARSHGHSTIKTWRWMVVQASRCADASLSYDWSKTRAVVTDYDRGIPNSPLILAAKKHGVPTFSLLHGDPNPVGYIPFIAETVLAWSQAQASTLRNWDSNPDIVVVGAHWIGLSAPAPNELHNALLVHTGQESFAAFVARHRSLSDLLAANGYKVRLRPHPHWGKPGRLDTGDAQVSHATLKEDLLWASEVFCGASSVALEAAHHGRIVVLEGGQQLELASLLGVALHPHPLVPDWRYLALNPGSGWPYEETGDTALRSAVNAITRRIA